MNDIATKLRELADELDKPQAEIVMPNMGISEAVKALAKAIKRGELKIEINWREWGKGIDAIEYKVACDYKTIAEAESLSECVQKAIVKHSPADTLDKLDEMMPKAKQEEAVA
jgi:hypothetical protein